MSWTKERRRFYLPTIIELVGVVAAMVANALVHNWNAVMGFALAGLLAVSIPLVARSWYYKGFQRGLGAGLVSRQYVERMMKDAPDGTYDHELSLRVPEPWDNV